MNHSPGITRREFIQLGATGLAWSALAGYGQEVGRQKKRVGLIGTGWYGKVNLFRLMQVAPVDVVSLCDADKHMLTSAAEMVEAKQGRKPRVYSDYPEMLKEKDLEIALIGTPDHWHALPMIAAV